jgi:hypothetical protein
MSESELLAQIERLKMEVHNLKYVIRCNAENVMKVMVHDQEAVDLLRRWDRDDTGVAWDTEAFLARLDEPSP